MDNKVFGSVFIAIIISALLFFGVANAGSYAVDQWIFPTEEFGEDTYIGTTNVSNMKLASAAATLSGQVESWRSAAVLQVVYQDAAASYPLGNAEVLMTETVEKAKDGSKNQFVFQLSPDTTRMFLTEQFPAVDFSDEQVAAINMELEQALAEGQSQTRVVISDDSIGLEQEIVAETSFAHNLQSAGAQMVLDALNSYEIEPNAQFSFLDFINELSIPNASDDELSEIASALYSVILQSNFIIEERSIGTKIPVNIPLGQEAAINRNLGIDLVFSNPNDNSFTMNFSKDASSLTASLSGYPFVYNYEIQTSRQEKVEPRLIKQYSAFISTGSSVKEPGGEGVRVEVLRSIINNGTELELQPVSTDFYPPVHRVEVYPLKAPVAGTTTPEDSLTGNTPTTDGSADKGTRPETGSDKGSSSAGSTGSESAETGTENDSDKNGNDNADNEGGSDNDQQDQNTKDPVYDKGGNLIKP